MTFSSFLGLFTMVEKLKTQCDDFQCRVLQLKDSEKEIEEE